MIERVAQNEPDYFVSLLAPSLGVLLVRTKKMIQKVKSRLTRKKLEVSTTDVQRTLTMIEYRQSATLKLIRGVAQKLMVCVGYPG